MLTNKIHILTKQVAGILALSILIATFFSINADARGNRQGDTKNSHTIVMNYDDRFVFDKRIKSINDRSVRSKKTGEDKRDDKVLKKTGAYSVVACGCGNSVVTLSDGERLYVKVKPAKLSLVMVFGQSNAEGFCTKKAS